MQWNDGDATKTTTAERLAEVAVVEAVVLVRPMSNARTGSQMVDVGVVDAAAVDVIANCCCRLNSNAVQRRSCDDANAAADVVDDEVPFAAVAAACDDDAAAAVGDADDADDDYDDVVRVHRVVKSASVRVF